MKIKTLVLIGVAVVVGRIALAESNPPLATVAHVDLPRYSGRWYEIARYPASFENACASDVTATYSPLPDGRIEVLNACRKADGQMKSSRGTARVVDAQTNAKLKVTFFWPFSGNYWVLDLAPDYSYAVVGEPGRKYLWILSRTPHMSETVYREIIARVRKLGYDPSRLTRTRQGGS